MKSEQRIKIDISTAAIVKVLAVVIGLLFIQKIQDILLMLFVVLIIVSALSPVIDKFAKQYAIPRWLAVTLIFGCIVLFLLVMVWLIFPLMFRQLIALLEMPQIKNLIGGTESSSVIDELKFLYDKVPGVGQNSGDFVAFFSGIFGGAVSLVTMLVLSLYLLLDEDGIKKFILSILPTKHKLEIVQTFHKIGTKMGAWLRGQLLLGAIVAMLDLAILLIFGVPYWLTLAIFAGVVELIPYIGPFLGLATALFVGITQTSMWGFSPIVVGIGVGVGMLLVQQLESHFLVPKIMERTVGLSPVVVIVAILIGAKLFGLVGIVLSVPAAAIISVIIDEWPTIQAFYHSNRTEIDQVTDEV